jgi:hypothetical protein
LKAVPPGNYSLVALSDAVRDKEFGTFEFDQVKLSAMQVQVRDASVTGLSLKSTNLRYAASACSSHD